MKPIVANLDLPAPRVLRRDMSVPTSCARFTLAELCAMAGIEMRVVGGKQRVVECCVNRSDLLYTDKAYFVGVGSSEWSPTRTHALRVLESIAYGFNDYAARECVCGRGLFCAPKKRGRPTAGAHAMTAKERMAKMRARHREASLT